MRQQVRTNNEEESSHDSLGNYDEDWFRSGAMNKYLILDHALEEPWEAIYFNDR